MTKLFAGAAAAAIAALLAGSAAWVWLRQPEGRFAECGANQVAGGAIGGPFTLVDQNGRTVTDSEVLAKPALLYFGYTFCPDVCPFDMARNAQAVDILAEWGTEVTPVFISIDPARDTPEQLKFFAEAIHPDTIALTGTEEQVKAASRAYKTFYRPQEAEGDYYLIDHSTYTYFMLPGTGFVDFFKREDTPEQIAERISCFVNDSHVSTSFDARLQKS
ncbi:SCO family protein [Cereibacter sphaeroides]|uniref:SCO family protein n=1 Tax=Cereibacter sphaeroides TaxID=1063 RepID=UPI001F2902A4|nr:SCO family protein [Cereibacter sphaeroides]MCE6952519.1 SCO family protein [Cereibacter sphaeroides]